MRYGTVDREYGARLATTAPDDDGPVWMVNLMRYREVAHYVDGRTVTISGREADDLYSPGDVMARIGAKAVFFADVDTQLLGDTPRWDRVAVAKYPTRRAFIDMQSRPDFRQKHEHKDAGMAETIVAGCQPLATGFESFDPESFPDWNAVPHPPTADDGPVTLLHLIRFDPKHPQAEAEMAAYAQHAAQVAKPHGARISAWFGVEGTIVGDGRRWDQVRFNAFPSKAAFMAVATDPARLEAQRAHREVAIADTYTFILRPSIDRLAQSIQS